MSRLQQIQFVAELSQAILDEVYDAINTEKIPGDWNGIELRRYLAYKFNGAVVGNMDKKRLREYRNTLLVNDL